MTVRKDPDRLIHEFLGEGQTRLADPVFDTVRATIEHKRQRTVIGPWRMPLMNKLIPLAIGAAAVVVVLVGGAQLLRPAPGGVVGAPSATPTPTPAPTAGPSVAAPSVAPSSAARGLPEGSHVLRDESGVRMTVTIAAPDWYGDPAGGTLVKNETADAPDGAGMIVFAGIPGYLVYRDPCKWESTTPKSPATTVDALVARLAAQATRDASVPVKVTVDGHAGKSITLHVPDDAKFSDCDGGTFASWGAQGASGPVGHEQDPGQIDKLWIVDVDGGLAIIDAGYYAGTPQAVLDELDAIVASLTFE